MLRKSVYYKVLKKLVYLLFYFFIFPLHAQNNDSLVWSYTKLRFYDKALSFLDSNSVNLINEKDRKKIFFKKIEILQLKGDVDSVLELLGSMKFKYRSDDISFLELIISRFYINNKKFLPLNNETGLKKLFALCQAIGDSALIRSCELIGFNNFSDQVKIDSLVNLMENRLRNENYRLNKVLIAEVLSKLYFKKSNINKACIYARYGCYITDSIVSIDLKIFCLRNCIEIHKYFNDFKNSFSYQEKLINILDSLNKSDSIESGIAARFLDKFNYLKSFELKNRLIEKSKTDPISLPNDFIILILSLSAFCLILLFFLVYVFNQYKKNKLLQADLVSKHLYSESKMNQFESDSDKMQKELFVLNNELDNIKLKNNEIILRYEKNIKDLRILNNQISDNLITSQSEIYKLLKSYYEFPFGKIDKKIFYSILTIIRKLRPGKMFAEKGGTKMQGVSERTGWLFCNVVDINSNEQFNNLPCFLKLRLAISEKKIKDISTWEKFISEEINLTEKFSNDSLSLSFLSFDPDNGELNFSGINSRIYIFRGQEIFSSTITNRAISILNGSFNVYSGDLIYLSYGLENEFSFQFEREMLSVLSALTVEEQLQILGSNQFSFLDKNINSNIILQFFQFN